MFQKIWQPDMVKEHILSKVGAEPLYSYYYATTYPQVHAAALRLFGSWKEAIAACNLKYAMVRRYRSWNKEQVRSEINSLAQQHIDLSSKNIQQSHKALYMAALKRFDSWEKALEYSGIKYDSVRIRQRPSPELLKKEIQSLYSSGENLSYTNMRKKHQFLLSHATRKLGQGSWEKARRVCGINDNFRELGQRKANRRRSDPGKYVFTFETLSLKPGEQ